MELFTNKDRERNSCLFVVFSQVAIIIIKPAGDNHPTAFSEISNTIFLGIYGVVHG